MIKLIFPLTGAQVLRQRWYWLAFGGAALLLLSAAILYDIGSDGLLSVPLDVLAVFFIVEGVVQLFLAISKELMIEWLTLLKALGFLLFAFLIFNIPQDNNDVSAVLFGLMFMLDGVFRIASSWVLRAAADGIRLDAGRCLRGTRTLPSD